MCSRRDARGWKGGSRKSSGRYGPRAEAAERVELVARAREEGGEVWQVEERERYRVAVHDTEASRR